MEADVAVFFDNNTLFGERSGQMFVFRAITTEDGTIFGEILREFVSSSKARAY